ncbi:MAG: hypothetical protein A3I04_01305 [Nitrospinae bacterium RIFCSPLOWO2_02_FULL_39_110]|nr:MAG: hypothetical protein A3D20_03545 [Nitrospinae bacterium RIFCSPHIGHO2_02_FULL_39_82]OGW04002.1 MAG: hypothetical protein A3I04_01305 [Nitrospinae bacterium RIFCSPLOWO2_02_FULL_39_110]
MSSKKIKKITYLTILILIVPSRIANGEQITLSIIPETVFYNWGVNEFEIKIQNPTISKGRIKIKAKCLNENNKIIKESTKEYEVMRTEDTTQMSITSERCKNIILEASETKFFTDEEKRIYKLLRKKN